VTGIGAVKLAHTERQSIFSSVRSLRLAGSVLLGTSGHVSKKRPPRLAASFMTGQACDRHRGPHALDP